jgi:hypothetical protein
MDGRRSADELLTVDPRLTGSPKMTSAFAFPMPITERMATAISMVLRFHIVFLLQNIIHTSYIVLLPGLQYYDRTLGLDAQTIRPGRVGPVSNLLVGVTLTGCFFLFCFSYIRL